jgi:two-component sensor histidine kinase
LAACGCHPPAQGPKRSGFGSVLIEGSIPGATVTRDFLPEGLKCQLAIPLKRTSNGTTE